MKLSQMGLAALFMLASIPASAGTVTAGYVTRLYVRQSDGLVYFETSGTINNRAGCGISNTTWVLPGENTETSKRQYAALLVAKASHLSIDVHGSGTCTRWGDSEDVNIIVVNDQ
ncbi:hypothetical protein SAMN02800692_1848 [Luteibacter sp. UNC138MFCol5.1]|uniref:hypothetical protein n=1 Tax=Luteibacter sp. UNC138MFCol5.1 TaxID=1502774 RepID=UPI0008CE95D6|nr:hypothetical protein [Luteibacter sp. UNC138MFCol5.1]SEO74305.1 hypothetical protein SAMN02800692_1848 [Luteibacter sp. UNC138MFCol5.1]